VAEAASLGKDTIRKQRLAFGQQKTASMGG
jgi:hypothetical protein